MALCAHAIEADGLFEVEDARRDPRFASNPLVQGERGVVFYAGMPLKVANGHTLGTLCVIDHVPRRLDADQRAALAALARQAVLQLEHRRLGLELQQQHESRVALEHALQGLATRDPLTGLENRNAFRHALAQALSLAQRRQQRLACIYFDLDNFKLVNDSLGHPMGDALLVAASQRVKSAIRESDVFARLGGDEFALLLHDVGDVNDVAHLAAKLRDLLCTPFVLDQHTVHIGCSLGIALAPDDGIDLDLLLRRADIALYHAKGEGKGDFRFYTPELNERVVSRVRLEQELRAALDNEEFELHYQPQVSCNNERVMGVEALLRWPREDREPVGSAVFVALAEELRLGRRLGGWVLERACEDFARWRADGLVLERLAVNITASQLCPDLVDEVLAVLARHELPPAVLELEVVENHIMKDIGAARRVIRRLREAGVQVALDDFGTGYSSLSLLRELDVDAVKVDRVFIERVQCGDGDTAIVSAVIALRAPAGLRVTAEGVEQSAQLVALRAMDCDDYQGFVASPALPATALVAMCRDWLA
ncbi:MAG: EAL domain-containing protein [Proteobacteria bacterium]|nr:EAL domain-containing protein [Pseudomonadota bacterium]